jgi:hypothetical protein
MTLLGHHSDPLSPVPIAHGGNPQTTDVPYTIDISSFDSSGVLQYTPGQTYTREDISMQQ